MAFYSPHWKNDVEIHLTRFKEQAFRLAEQYNDPYSIETFANLWLEEYKKFLEEKGPMCILKID